MFTKRKHLVAPNHTSAIPLPCRQTSQGPLGASLRLQRESTPTRPVTALGRLQTAPHAPVPAKGRLEREKGSVRPERLHRHFGQWQTAPLTHYVQCAVLVAGRGGQRVSGDVEEATDAGTDEISAGEAHQVGPTA